MYSCKYFTPEEFSRVGCDISQMSPELLSMLDAVRELSGIPLVITSAFRTVEHELLHGRDGSSSHCKGLAVDIRCYSSQWRFKIVTAALSVGFSRIGIASNFIHLDIDSKKMQKIIWTY